MPYKVYYKIPYKTSLVCILGCNLESRLGMACKNEMPGFLGEIYERIHLILGESAGLGLGMGREGGSPYR